ncbi:MAG: argininosuccinate lyase [Rhizobiales bacterium]|nr:argininosuccinate lyase [Hyphomicrobiales bacterium]
MKRSLFGAALALATFAISSAVSPAMAAKQDFELVNKTGYDISHVYVSPTKSEDWEEDVLGKDVLSDGDAWDIEFDRGDKTCKWDLKVVYADDNSSAYWRNIDLCKVEKITIRYNRKSDTTSATLD